MTEIEGPSVPNSHGTFKLYGNQRHKVYLLGPDINLDGATLNVSSGDITIGNGTFCGHNVSILTGRHYLNHPRERIEDGADITIGKHVWLASNCTIVGPCHIGDYCVIAAGAVVSKDCEAGWVYGGNPARKIKEARD